MQTRLASAAAIVLLSLYPALVSAQSRVGGEAITHFEGAVFVDGHGLRSSMSNVALSPDSIIRTESGRAEIRSATGDRVVLSEHSSMRLSRNVAFNSIRFEFLSGSAIVATGDLGPAIVCESELWLSDSGVFRFNVHRVGEENYCELRVYKGAAATRMQSFDWVLTAGKMIDLNRTCGDHTQRRRFNVEHLDELDRWNQSSEVSDVRRRQ